MKLKSRTFMAGTTMSPASSPLPGAHCRGKRLHLGKHLDQALVETEIPHPRRHAAALHQEGAVAGVMPVKIFW